MVSAGGGRAAAESPAVCRAAPNRFANRAEVSPGGVPKSWTWLNRHARTCTHPDTVCIGTTVMGFCRGGERATQSKSLA